MSKMAEFKILIGENTQEATSSSSHPRLNSFCLQPWLPCAQRRAQEPEGRKPWEDMGRKSGGKANPRKAPAQRGLAAHHHGCALCLGMPAPQQGPGSKKKGEKKKEGEKFKRAPERQAARWGFLSPLMAGRSWGTRALRQAACAPPPSSAARATQNPAPRARRNISRNLRCLSHRLHLSASDKKKIK